jgi:hypothetical protein
MLHYRPVLFSIIQDFFSGASQRGRSRGRGTGNRMESIHPSRNVVVPNTSPRSQSNDGGKECYIIDLCSFELFMIFLQGHQKEVVQEDGARETVWNQRTFPITFSFTIRPQDHSQMMKVMLHYRPVFL